MGIKTETTTKVCISPPKATVAASTRREENLRPRMSESRIHLVGGSAYSSMGGIQAMNRVMVRELESAALLRKAYFLWDEDGVAPEPVRDAVVGCRRSKVRFLLSLVRQAVVAPDDAWFCTHINYAALAHLAARGRKKKVGVMVHAAELDDGLTWSKCAALRQAGLVVAVSEYTKRKVIRLGVAPSRVSVLHNGVDDPCPRGPLPVKDGAPRVLFVGRMNEHYKGQGDLLDALAILRVRQPALRLVFVGGGASNGQYQAITEQKGLSERVEFAGHLSDEALALEFARATLFAMPSRNEGFGLVYAQAMAHGVPCIGSERDAAREVIEHGKTGLCVPAGNPVALAAALDDLLRDTTLRRNMAQAARHSFLSRFTILQYRDRLLTVMNRWLGR
jgi:phosphatidyl-myo-inositol dimannoside synthase